MIDRPELTEKYQILGTKTPVPEQYLLLKIDTASATNGSTYRKTEQISDILKIDTDNDTDVGVRNNENSENRQLNTAKIRLGSVSVSQ